jgi:hypothetical protein
MELAINIVRTLLAQADEALSRQSQVTRTPKQREADLSEARRAHSEATAMLEMMRRRGGIDASTAQTVGELENEVGDLGILISEIRFDEAELAVHHART